MIFKNWNKNLSVTNGEIKQRVLQSLLKYDKELLENPISLIGF